MADIRRVPRSIATAGEPGETFLSGKQRTISQISRRPNFTKFEHIRANMHVNRCRDENFRNKNLKILPYGVVFLQKCKNFSQIFNVLRLQASITPHWL